MVGSLGVSLADLLLPPFGGEGAGDQVVIVLQKLTEGDEDLSQVVEGPNGAGVILGLRHGIDLHQVPVREQGDGSLYGFAGGDGARLSRTFYLELCAYGHEAVHGHHGGGVEGDGSKARGPRPSVSEAEATRFRRVRQDRPARDELLHVLEVRRYARSHAALDLPDHVHVQLADLQVIQVVVLVHLRVVLGCGLELLGGEGVALVIWPVHAG